MQTPHILIVEDELVTRNTLKSIFEAEGYDVFEATDGAEMHQILSENDINLVIMDINLPGKNGLLLARELREQADVALMFLTGRDNEVDKILGLEIGADDYITKPFSMRELMARVKANMRRTLSGEEREKPQTEAGDGLRISRSSGMVYKNGRALELSAREFDILCFLAASPGRVFSREELMEHVWGYDYYGDLRAVDVAIRRLREKVEDEPASPKHIITKRGMGYYFAEG